MHFTFYSEKYKIGFCQEDKKYYLILVNDVRELIKEVHQGQIKFREKGSTIRISRNQLIQSMKKINMQVNDLILPF